MSRVLRILHLEGDPRDADLVAESLTSNGIECEIVRVDTGRAFEREVRAGGYDIIFSDFRLPAYDGSTALAFARRERPEVPFVLISGAVGEAAAIASMLDGAADYVLKDGLSRLVPSLQRALRESENWRARRRAEEALLASEQRVAVTSRRSRGWERAPAFVSTSPCSRSRPAPERASKKAGGSPRARVNRCCWWRTIPVCWPWSRRLWGRRAIASWPRPLVMRPGSSSSSPKRPAGRTEQGRSFTAHHPSSLADLPTCHIAFLAISNPDRRREALAFARNRS